MGIFSLQYAINVILSFIWGHNVPLSHTRKLDLLPELCYSTYVVGYNVLGNYLE